jgi:hypothetical protein
MKRLSIWTRYGFAWVTGALFILTLTGHWIFGWFAYANEQLAHQQPVEIVGYTVQMMRDTFENWQSEFLQLLWQVAGLALLLHVGSPQSKEGDDRMEAKLDAILLALEPEKGDKLLKDIDDEYEGRHTDARFVRMLERWKQPGFGPRGRRSERLMTEHGLCLNRNTSAGDGPGTR